VKIISDISILSVFCI